MKDEPAFPQTAQDEDGFLYEKGMTLRDYFAAKAMQGLIAGLSTTEMWGELTEENIAREAYANADALLKERERHAES